MDVSALLSFLVSLPNLSKVLPLRGLVAHAEVCCRSQCPLYGFCLEGGMAPISGDRKKSRVEGTRAIAKRRFTL